MKRIFRAFKHLQEGDFRVLSSIEAGMRRRELVPKAELLKYTRMDLSDLEFHLKQLDELGLILAKGTPYEGYRLVHRAYDFLALNVFVRRDEVESLGNRLAVGKESEVYEILGPDDEPLVVKFHRLGLTSFKKTVRLRGYIGDRRHFSWIYASRLAAQREFEALRRLKGQVPIPAPIDQNRNAILMSMFDGLELAEREVDRPDQVLGGILDAVQRARDTGIVHGDLSEFNVLVGEGDFVIIDWPQWLETTHPQARATFTRDLSNIFNFFGKKYPEGFTPSSLRRLRARAAWEAQP